MFNKILIANRGVRAQRGRQTNRLARAACAGD
jgi:hypothetical protein